MNLLKNNVQLIGRLGAKPEVKNFDGGKKMATFSLATNEVYTNAHGDKIEDTHWHRVVTWGKKAEIAERFLDKGKQVIITGKLGYRKFEIEGIPRTITEITALEIILTNTIN